MERVDYKANFRKNLKRLRKADLMSQGELATLLNDRYGTSVNRATVSKWETGSQTPGVKTVAALADFFGVSVDELLN